MALRQGQREQLQMLPPSIEQYIDQEAPVRVYDAFVEALDLAALGIQINPTREGNPAYDPRAMLKLLVYGYSYGVRSSRKLEREVYYNLSFIWLMGGLRPDHKTIAEFRRGNKAALKQALTQCVKLCLKLDLIAGNILFVDGSKIRGNAAIKNTWDQDKCRKVLEKAEQRIAEILAEAESMDQAEEGLPSLTSLPSELTKASNLKQRVEEIMGELQASGHKSLNTVDPECNRMNSLEGTHAGYNAQVVVDDKQGLIVEADVVRNNNDLGQFSAQIAQAVDILGKLPQVGVADSGYSDTPDLVKIDRQQIQVIVPSKRKANEHRQIGEFDKQRFQYDQERDCYICPRGQVLKYQKSLKKDNSKQYQGEDRNVCHCCNAYGKCTTSQTGRKVTRLIDEDLRERLEAEYALPENQAIYKRRKEKVELVFGHLKRNLGVSSFLMRGLAGARAEMGLLAVCFNIRRIISLLGIACLLQKLQEASQTCEIMRQIA